MSEKRVNTASNYPIATAAAVVTMLTHQDRAAERTSGTTGDNTRDNYDRNHQKPDVPKKRKLCKREFKRVYQHCICAKYEDNYKVLAKSPERFFSDLFDEPSKYRDLLEFSEFSRLVDEFISFYSELEENKYNDKRIVERLIKENGLELDINSIPIASKGYLKDGSVSFERLRADSLTDISKDVFQAVGISSEVLSTLEIEMEEGIEKLEVSESSVTAYLLRRNFATHLKILGLDHPDIQYLLGHCIDDPYVNRPDYTDSRLYSISKLLSNRPLVNEAPETTICLAPYSDTTLSGNETIKMNSNGTTVVRIYALEKEDSLIIKPNDSIILNYREEYKAFEPHRGIDILKKYMGDYGTS